MAFQNHFGSVEDVLEMSKNGKLRDFSDRVAFFDARAFNVPKEDVVNAFIWRQQDCTRNSIQMVGRANFSHKELMNLSCNQIQEKLWKEKNINWNDFPPYQKRGTSVYKEIIHICPKCKAVCSPPVCSHCTNCQVGNIQRTNYKIDTNSPIFTQDRNYIQKWVDINKE
jgi:tRNA(His) 5'-end guanylyltransferase